MKKTIFFTFAQILVFSFCQAQSDYIPDKTDMPENGRAGACYVKCLIPNRPTLDVERMEKMKWERQPYFIYKGTDTSAFIKEIIVYDDLPTEKLVKRTLSPPCPRNQLGEISCEYEVRIQEGGTKVKIKITTDTARYKPAYLDFYYPLSKNKPWIDSVEKKEAEEEADAVPQEEKTEWREVLCDTRVNSSIIQSIALQLEKEGLFNMEKYSSNILGEELKAALKAYQRKYHLPVGNLNLETLRALGVYF